jgi:epoxyqueuosine reductase QueG
VLLSSRATLQSRNRSDAGRIGNSPYGENDDRAGLEPGRRAFWRSLTCEDVLAQYGVRSAAAAAMHNCDPATLTCPWSHKSVAVIAGLGSFGLHRMVITDAGCAGRFGSPVIAAESGAKACGKCAMGPCATGPAI